MPVPADPSTPPGSAGGTGPPAAPGPCDPRLLDALRTEVGRFRAGQVRRRFAAALHVGDLAGLRVTASLASPEAYDAGLRADVVSGLLDRLGPEATAPCAWLTRPGDMEPQDLDLAWLAAAAGAFGSHGRDLPGFYVVSRVGWLDVRSGERRLWKRLRLSR